MSALIISNTHDTNDGYKIGMITLNNPKALNAQNLEMVKAMTVILKDWQTDMRIKAVVLRGAGDRALCAGGDIKALAQASHDEQVADFFRYEYDMMHQMHLYPKPIIAWGDGIVMGGGLGLLSACSHKLVTPRTVMAMPEVSIGLFPDAGGSYFLRRMMGKVGLFLGLTGAHFTGVDAMYLGLGDIYTARSFDEVMALLCQANWCADMTDTHNHGVLTKLLSTIYDAPDLKDSQVLANFNIIHHLMNAGSLADVDRALKSYQGDNDYIKSAQASYLSGSDTTKAVTWRIYHMVATYSLAEIYQLEAQVATQSVLNGDFAEGVRALLIDKDKNPKWRYTLDNMPQGYIDGLFGQ